MVRVFAARLRVHWFLLLLVWASGSALSSGQSLEELLGPQESGSPLDRMLRWKKFLAGDCQKPEVLPSGSSDRILAEHVCSTLDQRFRELAETGSSVTLTDYGKGKIRGYDRGILTVEFKDHESKLSLFEIDRTNLIAQLRKKKGKTAEDYVCIAVLSYFLGDQANVRKSLAKADSFKDMLASWLDSAEVLQAESEAADKLEKLLRIHNDDFIQQTHETWPHVEGTQVATQLRKRLREKFEEQAFDYLNGERGLARVLQGKVKVPKKTESGFAVELTYDFKDAAQMEDFNTEELAKDMRTGVRYLNDWWHPPQEMEDWSVEDGALVNSQANYCHFRLEFSAVSEISITAKVPKETTQDAYAESFIGFGLHDDARMVYLLANNLARLLERRPSEYYPTAYKDIETTPGEEVQCVVKITQESTTIERNGEVMGKIRSPTVRRGRPFLIGGGERCWNVSQLYVKGEIGATTLQLFAKQQAREMTRAVFGS
jgi:hypothetical protein